VFSSKPGNRRDLPHVFERFRQGDESGMARHGGLGLGLAIGGHLMELHGGRIDVRSAAKERERNLLLNSR
jgi:signal transduction histidine kinase